ncbi:MAG: porin family protein [Chitinophagaceae bacterium]
MKRILLVAVLCAGAFTIRSVAQEQATSGERTLTPKIGIKAGVNLSNLYVDDVKDENMKVGYNFGLYAKLPVAKGFSIQPELLYTSKGSKLAYDNAFGTGEYRFNLNYIEVPVLAVLNLTPNFNLQLGGYASYLTSANIKNLDKDKDEISDVASLKTENFNRFDYGLVGGLGVDIQNFTIGARYNYGLREVGKSGSIAGQATNNSKNSVISVFLGLGF